MAESERTPSPKPLKLLEPERPEIQISSQEAEAWDQAKDAARVSSQYLKEKQPSSLR